jgi:hypothetical protein
MTDAATVFSCLGSLSTTMNKEDKLWAGIKEEFAKTVHHDQNAQDYPRTSEMNILGFNEQTADFSSCSSL